MTLKRMEHVGIVVDDIAAAIEFFVELGLELQLEVPVEGRSVDRINGQLVKYHAPPGEGGDRRAPPTSGIRHIAFSVEDIDAVVADLRAHGAELVGEIERYEDSYRLCYIRGREGIIVELAEQIG
jgi:catechol 2,3-dioxygenase-like lactoylglutathione lyase family enzyme